MSKQEKSLTELYIILVLPYEIMYFYNLYCEDYACTDLGLTLILWVFVIRSVCDNKCLLLLDYALH